MKNHKMVGIDTGAIGYIFDMFGNVVEDSKVEHAWILDTATLTGTGSGHFESAISCGSYNYRFEGLGLVYYYGPDLIPLGIHYGDPLCGVVMKGTAITYYTDGPYAGGKLALNHLQEFCFHLVAPLGGSTMELSQYLAEMQTICKSTKG